MEVIRRALIAEKNLEYVSHLSLNLVIALLATFWVLYVFSFAGWFIYLNQYDKICPVETRITEECIIKSICEQT